ncbi:hypothetical protein LINGRAPRIM_LOCUS3353 [Linum grandiflorum]
MSRSSSPETLDFSISQVLGNRPPSSSSSEQRGRVNSDCGRGKMGFK